MAIKKNIFIVVGILFIFGPRISAGAATEQPLPDDHWSLMALHELAAGGLIPGVKNPAGFPYNQGHLTRYDAAFYTAQAQKEYLKKPSSSYTKSEAEGMNRLLLEFRDELTVLKGRIQDDREEAQKTNKRLDALLAEFTDIENAWQKRSLGSKASLSGSWLTLTWIRVEGNYNSALTPARYNYPQNPVLYPSSNIDQYMVQKTDQDVGVGMVLKSADDRYTIKFGTGTSLTGTETSALGGSFPIPSQPQMQVAGIFWGTNVLIASNMSVSLSPLTLWDATYNLSKPARFFEMETYSVPTDTKNTWNTKFSQMDPPNTGEFGVPGMKINNPNLPFGSQGTLLVYRLGNYGISETTALPPFTDVGFRWSITEPSTNSTYGFNLWNRGNDVWENSGITNGNTWPFNESARSITWDTKISREVPYFSGSNVKIEVGRSTFSGIESFVYNPTYRGLGSEPIEDRGFSASIEENLKNVPILNSLNYRVLYYDIGPDYLTSFWTGSMNAAMGNQSLMFLQSATNPPNYMGLSRTATMTTAIASNAMPNYVSTMQYMSNRRSLNLLLSPRFPFSLVTLSWGSAEQIRYSGNVLSVPYTLASRTFSYLTGYIGGYGTATTGFFLKRYSWPNWKLGGEWLTLGDPQFADPKKWKPPHYTFALADWRLTLSKFIPLPRVTYLWLSGFLQSVTPDFVGMPDTGGTWFSRSQYETMLVYNILDPVSLVVGYGAEIWGSQATLTGDPAPATGSPVYTPLPLHYVNTVISLGFDYDLPIPNTYLNVRDRIVTHSDLEVEQNNISGGDLWIMMGSSYNF